MSDRREEAKRLSLEQGLTQEAIAQQFGVSRRTIERWASEDGWGARRKAQKVVSIGDAKGRGQKAEAQAVNSTAPTSHHNPPPLRPRRQRGQIDELQIVEDAIDSLSGLLGGMSAGGEIDTRGIGGVAGALVKLLEYRRKVQPPTAAELAEQVLAMGINPAEFVAELKRSWQQRA